MSDPADPNATQINLSSNSLNSTTDSFQSYRAATTGEEADNAKLLSCEEFVEKSETVIKHLRSQQRISLKSIEEMYALQLRRNSTTDRFLTGIEQ